jgi:hypothetical protein
VDAGDSGDAVPGTTNALKQLHGTLERYAGWLDRERSSMLVRADVRALGAAIDACADPSSLLHTLETNIARLPGGEMRKMLRVAAGEMRRALAQAQ